MKELKSYKNHKKKPGEFKKSKQRNKNIQHNRDQLKLLKEEKIDKAELFILDPDGFKKVTIERGISYGPWPIVYLSHHGKKSKLRTGTLIGDDGGDRLKILEEGYIDPQHCFGTVINVEVLKANPSIP